MGPDIEGTTVHVRRTLHWADGQPYRDVPKTETSLRDVPIPPVAVSALREHGFTAFAAYRSAVQSIGRWRVTDFQVPVFLRGATATWVKVHPGDFVIGDEDGAIVVPAAVVDPVLEAAEAMTQTETRVRASLRDGMSLNQALEKYGHV